MTKRFRLTKITTRIFCIALFCAVLYFGKQSSIIYAQNVTVTYTINGFSPATVTIQKGDTVTWTKSSINFLEVASDQHPTHLMYPPLNLRIITQNGGTESLQFNDVGTFGYHNHLSEQHTGTVIVTASSGTSTPSPSLTLTLTPTRTPTISPTGIVKPGDANGDNKVDGIDYVAWLSHYGQTTTRGSTDGDYNRDGKVDGIDYVVWLTNYGR